MRIFDWFSFNLRIWLKLWCGCKAAGPHRFIYVKIQPTWTWLIQTEFFSVFFFILVNFVCFLALVILAVWKIFTKITPEAKDHYLFYFIAVVEMCISDFSTFFFTLKSNTSSVSSFKTWKINNFHFRSGFEHAAIQSWKTFTFISKCCCFFFLFLDKFPSGKWWALNHFC